nr:MAG TPA: hypothetical protein [Caudoviricetes sp.]
MHKPWYLTTFVDGESAGTYLQQLIGNLKPDSFHV